LSFALDDPGIESVLRLVVGSWQASRESVGREAKQSDDDGITPSVTWIFYRKRSINANMPVFEFRCLTCHFKFSTLVGMTQDASSAVECPNCGGAQTQKLVSRFQRGRSEDDRLDEMADRLELYGDPDSPSEMRRMVKELGKATDDDVSADMESLFESDMDIDALQ
jgi:putative FmdB family regulatory protein